MIEVALLTTWGPGCGTSEHARHILEHVKDPDVHINIVGRTIGDFVNRPAQQHYDIVHVNESGWIMQGSDDQSIPRLKAKGYKTVLTMCNPIPTNNRNPWTGSFDRTVMFEPHTTDGFEYVPIGAPVYRPEHFVLSNPDRKNYIGTNGFPQDRKNLVSLAVACQHLGMNLMSFQPMSQHADTMAVAKAIRQVNPGAFIVTNWVTDKEMLDNLSMCIATCYPYIEWIPGSSSAAMAGVSARRPIVVSRCTQMRFLEDHNDEVYFIDASRPTVDDIIVGLQKMLDDPPLMRKIPQQVYQKHNWDAVGQRYAEIYKGVMQ